MAGNYKLTYNVDLVFCIDATGSMDNIIDIIKNNAMNFHNDLLLAAEKKKKVISNLRIRLIVFRDYLADGENAMLNTEFFNLPDENQDFKDMINAIVAEGGGDDPEDGLEALGFAIKSKWGTEGIKRRQIIVVWSDDGTHPIGYGAKADNYPRKMAKDFNELTAWWGNSQNSGFMNYHFKRLILFTPDMPDWDIIAKSWENTVHYPSIAGEGLKEIEYIQILDSILNSI